MPRRKICLCAIITLVIASISPVTAIADPVEVSKSNVTTLRALFQTPAFNMICPLSVYSEDLSDTAVIRRADLTHSRTRANPAGMSVTVVVQEKPRGLDADAPDGLVDYGEEFNSAEAIIKNDTLN